MYRYINFILFFLTGVTIWKINIEKEKSFSFSCFPHVMKMKMKKASSEAVKIKTTKSQRENANEWFPLEVWCFSIFFVFVFSCCTFPSQHSKCFNNVEQNQDEKRKDNLLSTILFYFILECLKLNVSLHHS